MKEHHVALMNKVEVLGAGCLGESPSSSHASARAADADVAMFDVLNVMWRSENMQAIPT
jgi:hypothetical protein